MMRGSGKSCKWGMVMVGYIQDFGYIWMVGYIQTFQ